MYAETIDKFAENGASKLAAIIRSPLGFLIGAALAGAYIGFGDIILFTAGAHLTNEFSHLIMGAVFASALSFVIFAGAELFTGMAMYMPFAVLRRKASIGGLIGVWLLCWIGNLIGSAILAYLVKGAGGGVLLTDGSTFFFNVVQAKMTASGSVLFFRGMLCNWLVCLAIWMAARTTNDVAKLVLIFWGILVFVAAGFEHSVANMFDFVLALIVAHPDAITLGGAIHNEIFVTLGNIVGALLFIVAAYYLQDSKKA